jgi:hypothetical protein
MTVTMEIITLLDSIICDAIRAYNMGMTVHEMYAMFEDANKYEFNEHEIPYCDYCDEGLEESFY